jgi:hypothetical protein
MKSRYDNTPGKDAPMANRRQGRFEAEHMARNQFVKKVQAEQARHGGKPPKLEARSMEFNAYMCNNGEHAQMLGKKLTSNIDHVAFPVDGEGNDS